MLVFCLLLGEADVLLGGCQASLETWVGQSRLPFPPLKLTLFTVVRLTTTVLL